MHGRLKVKTSSEQQEEKRKERAKKAQEFTSAMKLIFYNRGKEEENEVQLNITEKVLLANPDVYTLWNIRKEIFLKMKEKGVNIDERLKKELNFLQNCLHVNPKSYGVWNQRRFAMKELVTADWERELQLCNLFLQYDERNFHCWDYRRFVVREANVSYEQELDFTSKKIKENFSNYSSWHNRSKLIPILHPEEAQARKVVEGVILKEFEFVQNAFFTDPNDQSAWFYQRWLLGRKETSPKLLSTIVQRNPPTIIASLSLPIESTLLSQHVLIDDENVDLQWECNSSDKSRYSNVWKAKLPALPDSTDQYVQMDFGKLSPIPIKLNLKQGENKVDVSWWKDSILGEPNERLFSDTHTKAKSSVLENELDSCKMLLEEEPDNKWTMLTIVYLMRALDGLKYVIETDELLQKLVIIDPMRSGYYEDLRSKYRIEDELQRCFIEKKSHQELDLSNKELTTFSYIQYFTTCRKLDLRNNKLKSIEFLSLLPVTEVKL